MPKTKLAANLKSKVKTGAPHVIVEARAGTGKTTTLVEGLRLVRGEKSKLTPSPQQEAVWNAMTAGEKPNTICFVAFNKSIATELQDRVPAGCDAMTMHSMGLKAVTAAFGRCKVSGWRVSDIISEIAGKDIRELRKHQFEMIRATEKLVGLCKMNLVDGSDPEELARLAAHYDVDMNGSSLEVYDLVPKVLERCKDVAKDKKIDFDDMIWLPVILGLPVTCYDLLLVDEAQDLNLCQQSLALAAGKRLILCGDPKQAIYGFAGADSDSMPRMEETLSATDAGCVHLPLTVTRRCGKAIVREANRYVPDFSAFDGNGEGLISRRSMEGKENLNNSGTLENAVLLETDEFEDTNYQSWVEDGDMILCRVNSPLVSQCFKFLRQDRKAYIQGRDIGQGLISTIKKMKADSLPDLIGKLSDWYAAECLKENSKRNPSESKLIALQDRKDCIEYFTDADGMRTVDDVIKKIESVFSDDSKAGIRLSSVHKAKGLEAKRVFILQPKGAAMPHPMAKSEWQIGQEYNLLYVAITRAIDELVYVS